MSTSFKLRDHTKRFKQSDIRAVKFERVCSATGILFFVPLVSTPESRCARFCANQGLIMLIIELLSAVLSLICGLILGLLAGIPIIGLLFAIVRVLLFAAVIALNLALISFGIYCAAKDRIIEIPILGRLRLFR